MKNIIILIPLLVALNLHAQQVNGGQNQGTDYVTACDSFTWINGITYTSSNYTDSFLIPGGAVNGMDSLVFLNLTVNYTTTGIHTVTACDSYTWINGMTYTGNNNTATYTLPGATANGCDSIVTLNLTINYSPTATQTVTACDSYTWINGTTYTAGTNTATHTVPGTAANGCDSIITLNLTIDYSATVTQNISACDSYTWINGTTYTAGTNTATHILPGAALNGCDSIFNLNLVLNYTATGTDNVQACNTFTWIDGITYTASNNTATFTIIGGSTGGCDSIVTLNLTLNNTPTGTQVVTACDNYTWIDGITYTANNNIATYNIPGGASTGCDSLVTLNLTLNPNALGTQTVTACDKFTWIDGNNYTATNNTATHIIPGVAANGCDSILTLNLTILNSGTSIETITSCDSYTWIDGNTYTTNNNTATFTIPGASANGCDSIISLNLYVNTINTNVTQAGNVLSCNQTGASFQWLDCNNNFAPIPGATSSTFTAPGNGDYAVKITFGTCIDTSACVNVFITETEESNPVETINIFPNPNSGEFNIETNVDAQITITDATGREVYSKQHFMGTENIQLSNESNGLYFVMFNTENQKSITRMVISK